MKKLTAIIIIFVLFVIISVLFIFFPPINVLQNIPLVKDLFTNGTISVNSPNSKSEIYINDKSYGETNQTISNLTQGTYTIKLERVTDATSTDQYFYNEAVFIVEVTNNTESIVNIEVGPSSMLAGYILYYSKSPSSLGEKGFLTISSSPDNSSIYIDNQFLAKTPVLMEKLDAGEYTLRVEAQGYEEVEVPIIIRSDYNLNVNTYLFPVPINYSDGWE